MDTYPQNCVDPIHKKMEYNNTSINNKEEEKENKESETQEERQAEVSLIETDKVIDFYNNNITLITQVVFESIEAYRKDGLQDDLIIAAMKDAVYRNKRNWKYVDATLRNCRNNNIFTEEQFKINQKEFKENVKKNKETQRLGKIKEIAYNTDFSEYDEYARKKQSG